MEPSSPGRKFETICQYMDTPAGSLNTRFESYGCSILEAKVPIVSDAIVQQLKNADDEDRLLGTLALKAKSASSALEGRAPRTRNKDLNMVKLGKDVILATGKERERSPVDPDKLDEEIEEYMRVAAEKKRRLALQDDNATNSDNVDTSEPIFKPLSYTKPKIFKKVKQEKMDHDGDNNIPETEEGLDADLEAYMARAKSMKVQKQRIAAETDRAAMMEEVENWDL